MAILHRFLRLLYLLEDVAEFAAFLTTPAGATIVFCLLCYQACAIMGCDAPTAAGLASMAALTLHYTMNQSQF